MKIKTMINTYKKKLLNYLFGKKFAEQEHRIQKSIEYIHFLEEELIKLKAKKQLQINKTNEYWKKQLSKIRTDVIKKPKK